MSHEPLSIALIEDDPIMGESLNQCLELEGYRVEWWRTGRDALAGLSGSAPDLVICDIRLPDISGADVFRKVAADPDAPPFLFMTAFGQIDQAVALMRAGAGDYLTKPFEVDDLLARARALVTRRASGAAGVLGVSSSMRDIEDLLRRIARHPSPVLFTGETGVGKRSARGCSMHSLARRMSRSSRSIAPRFRTTFSKANSSATRRERSPERTARHLGYAERARRGTLFLDEVAELPLALQAKLLRLIEERSLHRVGGETAIPFRARIVCASNRDMTAEVASRRFRDDLFYRINVVTIDVPPLRDRSRGYPMAAGAFLRGAHAIGGDIAARHFDSGRGSGCWRTNGRAMCASSGTAWNEQWLSPTASG